MQIVFDLPHVFHEQSSSEEDAIVLRTSLEYLIALDLAYLRYHPTESLYRNRGVVYGRTTEWDAIPAIVARGYADCKSLSAWRIAELRLQGLQADPTFRWFVRPEGGKGFHILVRLPGYRFEDPSRLKGMGNNEFAYLMTHPA